MTYECLDVPSLRGEPFRLSFLPGVNRSRRNSEHLIDGVDTGRRGPVSRAAAAQSGEDGTWRCDMMLNVAICVYCSHKIEEKEKSVNVPHLPGGVAHLACAQKVMIRTKNS